MKYLIVCSVVALCFLSFFAVQKPVIAQSYNSVAVSQATMSRDQLIQKLLKQVAVLQQLLRQMQIGNPVSETTTTGTWQSSPGVVVNNKGPKNNVMSCAGGVDLNFSDGALACYGLHDYGDEFGDDQANCGGLDPDYEQKVPTGCVVPAPVCKSNRAIATEYYSIRSASPQKISELAKNFQATEAAVRDQLIRVWEYDCTDKALTGLTSTIDQSQINQNYGGKNSDWSFVDNAADVLVVGAYTGSDNDGSVNVNVTSANQDSLLVLTAYDPVTWNLSGTALKNVKAVFVTGYGPQKITGLPAGVKVTSSIYETDRSEDYFYAYERESVKYYELMNYLRTKTGYKPYLFWGAYQQTNVIVSIKG